MLNSCPLLAAHIFTSFSYETSQAADMVQRLTDRHITVKFHKPQYPLTNTDLTSSRVYISVGENWNEFITLRGLPLHERKRWLHYSSFDDIHPNNLFHCLLVATEPLPLNKEIPPTTFSSDEPLVSIFTAAFKSGDKIKRPYQSLLAQTYTNWEWVIVDDSGDNDETYINSLLPLNDSRIRRYRQDSSVGYIGSVKRYAAGLCTGEILVEVDHDDALTSDCLEKIVKTFKKYPECGFAFGEDTEVYWENNHAHWYGWDFGYGYGLCYRVFIPQMNRWQNVSRTADLNWQTIRHLVGLPNHPRAWTRDCYHHIGGHRPQLFVADDYDLLVRTFLCTKFVRIPHLLYLQYRNSKGDNSTFIRNQQIQILCQELERYYRERINQRIEELELPSLQDQEYSRCWEIPNEHPKRKKCDLVDEDETRTSLLFPIPYGIDLSDHTELFQALKKGLENQFKDFEIIITGNIPPEVETYASRAPMGSIRWWPMEPHDSLDNYIRYAQLCASCSKKTIVNAPPLSQ